MNDDTKDAPSLAERYRDNINLVHAGSWTELDVEVFAALRAVEAVRAFEARPYTCPWLSCHDNQRACIQCDAYRDGVEAVQALLEGER